MSRETANILILISLTLVILSVSTSIQGYRIKKLEQRVEQIEMVVNED